MSQDNKNISKAPKQAVEKLEKKEEKKKTQVDKKEDKKKDKKVKVKVDNDSQTKSNKKPKKNDQKLAKEKTKRPPSPYNLFMKKNISELKKNNPSMLHKEAFCQAAKLWNEQKNKEHLK